jgi:hypothetical protein
MPDIVSRIHITNVWGVCILLVLWIVLFKCAHLLVMLIRREPVIGWAVGPLGITLMVLHEPSTIRIWLDVLGPALVSGGVLYMGLFTALSPITLPQHPLVPVVVITCGVLLSSTGDFVNAWRDLRHPLWGEARILRSIQFLRATWAKIHFTPFGYSYLSDHFKTTPTDLLQAL